MMKYCQWCGALMWGGLMSVLLCSDFFSLPEETFFKNHDGFTYGWRVLEFRDCLTHGYLTPQWCTHFRGGLGSPYFNYYQPGFFYVASAMPSSLPLPQQLGLAVLLFTLAGYLGACLLVGERGGWGAGALAGGALLAMPYCETNLYIRGDFAEHAALMVVPWLLYFLDRWQFTGNARYLLPLSGAGGLLVITHPAVAVAVYGFLTLSLLGTSLITRRYRSSLLTLAALVAGGLLVSFYWLPVVLELGLVQARQMWDGSIFEGHYHYSRHFISLREMLSTEVTQTVIPVKLGWIPLGALLLSLAWMLLKRREFQSRQKRLLLLAGALSMGSLFLITPWSKPVWDHLPVLQRTQFPWRLLGLVSIGLAAVTGLGASLGKGRLPTVARLALTGLVALPLCSARHLDVEALPPVSTAAGLANMFVAPDITAEWMPAGAQAFYVGPGDAVPRTSGRATVENYQVAQGLLSCTVNSPEDARIVLAHYWFPVGWQAELNQQPVSLERTRQGLMTVFLPAGSVGELTIRFSTTPLRRWGAALGLVTLVSWLGFLYWLSRRATNSDADGETASIRQELKTAA